MTQENVAASGGTVYAVQHGDQYVYVCRERPPYRVSPMPAGAPALPDDAAPSLMLAPAYEIVAFTGRDADLADLVAWRDATSGRSIRLLTGPGGQGKTRLGIEAARRATAAGWTAAWVRHRSEVASTGSGDEHLTVGRTGLLLVVDHAERWPLADLVMLLRQHGDAAKGPLRLLLLARSDAWWPGAAAELSKVGDVAVDAMALAPVTDDRRVAFAAARDAFAARFGVDQAYRISPPADIDEDTYAQLLNVHLAALAAITSRRNGDNLTYRALNSTLYLLHREQQHWIALYDDGRGVIDIPPADLARAVWAATLLKQVPHEVAVAAMEKSGYDRSESRRLVDAHTRAYPPDDPASVFAPLLPDRLGEDFLALELPGNGVGRPGDPWAVGAAIRLMATDSTMLVRRGLPTLVEIAKRWPHVATGELFPLLREIPDIVQLAGSAAVAALADVPGLDPELFARIDASLPLTGLPDVDSGAAVFTARFVREAWPNVGPDTRATLAARLSQRYANIGRLDEAVAAQQRAIEILEPLAHNDPTRYRAALASALNNLGGRQSSAGRGTDALATNQRAVTHFEALAAEDPRFEGDLAGARHNHAITLYDLGRVTESLAEQERAVAVAERRAAREPAARDDLALMLTSLGRSLAAAGRIPDALATTARAVDIYRALATPDKLAAALANLGLWQQELGRSEASLESEREATGIYERLAAQNPGRYRADLAIALENQAVALGALGRPADAVTLGRRATAIWEELSAAYPKAYERQLAASLANLANRMAAAGASDEGLVAAERSADGFARLAADEPAVFRRERAAAMVNRAAAMMSSGRYTEAAAASAEALTAWRDLAAAEPRLRGDLTKALLNSAMAALGVDDMAGSEALAMEASTVLGSLIEAEPWLIPRLHATYDLLAAIYEATGRSALAAMLRASPGRDAVVADAGPPPA